MGAVCSGICNKDKPNLKCAETPPHPAAIEHEVQTATANDGEPDLEKHLVCGASTAAGSALTADTHSYHGAYEDSNREKLLEMTADQFGIDLDPVLNETGPNKEPPAGCRYTFVTPAEHRELHSVKFGYKTHHTGHKRHGSSLVNAHEIKGHYTDTGIYISYDVLDKILKARQETTEAGVSEVTTTDDALPETKTA